MLPFSEIQGLVIDKLQKGLAPTLTYHNVSHTLDVLRQATEIAARESFVNEEDLLLLKVGALYHDVGFLNTYAGHEEKSCLIAGAELAGF
jgi:putative nucleotidyltransferase with HDIG domain